MAKEPKTYRTRQPMSTVLILVYVVLVLLIVGGIWLTGHNAKQDRLANPPTHNSQTHSDKPIITPQ